MALKNNAMAGLANRLSKTPTEAITGTTKEPQTSREQSTIEPQKQQKETIEEPQKDQEKKYMRLDITGLDEYLKEISQYNKKSMTKYIQELIEADKEKNQETYKKLLEIKSLLQNI